MIRGFACESSSCEVIGSNLPTTDENQEVRTGLGMVTLFCRDIRIKKIENFSKEHFCKKKKKAKETTHCSRFVAFSDGKVLLEDAVHDAADTKRWLNHVWRELVNCRRRQMTGD